MEEGNNMARREFSWPKVSAVIAAIVAVFAGGTLIITVTNDDEPGQKPVVTKVDTLDGSPDKDKTITVPAAAAEEAADALSGKVDPAGSATKEDADHTGLKDETPEGVPASLLEADQKAIEQNRKTTEALPTAGATGGFAGCRTQFVRNQSSRRGVRPTIQVLHYTVSPNRPGWSDVNAITSFFNQSRTQASSHFVIDAEGNCAYIVPIEAKAWANAGGNSFSVQYEIIATGKEANYLDTAGYAKLRSVMAEVSRRTGIPMRRGTISGCVPVKTGNVQHKDGGICWGGHFDISPFDLGAVLNKVQGESCDLKCRRTRSHIATHAEIKRRRCAPIDKTRSERCLTLRRRDKALHKVGIKFG